MDKQLIGKRIRLVRIEDPYTDLKNGDLGTITGVDDLGQIMTKWDKGSTLSLIPEVDEYEILENERKIYTFQKFLEFVNSDTHNDSYIDSKLSELEDLVTSFTEGKDLMYEWKNDDDHNIVVTYQINGVATKFEMDLDNGMLVKTKNDKIVMEQPIDSPEEGLDMIEKEIQMDLGITESFRLFEEFDKDGHESHWEKFIYWLGEKDFELYDGEDDLKKNFLNISSDNDFSAKEKAQNITSYLDLKWGVYDGYQEIVDYLTDLFMDEIKESIGDIILEKNVPNNQSLWNSCKAWAKSKYDVWPSAYACGAAAKRYKSKGGTWRKSKKKSKGKTKK